MAMALMMVMVMAVLTHLDDVGDGYVEGASDAYGEVKVDLIVEGGRDSATPV